MAITTVSDLNSHFNNLYNQTWFVEREYSLMPNLVTRPGASLGMAPRVLKSYGSTSATTIAEGGTPTAINQSITSHGTITPVIAIYYGILTDEQIATNPEDSVDQLSMEAGMALGQQIDQALIGEFSNFDNSVGSGGAVPTLAQLQTAQAYLANEDAVGPRMGVLGAGQWLAVSKELTQTGNSSFAGMFGDVANEAMREYFEGRFIGVNWFQNSNIGTTGTAGTAVGGIFTRRALYLDERSVGGPVLQQEENRPRHGGRWDITWRYRRGVATDHSNEGVQVTTSNAIT